MIIRGSQSHASRRVAGLMTGARILTRTAPTRLSRRSQKRRRCRQRGVGEGDRMGDTRSGRTHRFPPSSSPCCRFTFVTIHCIHTPASFSSPPCSSNAFGNQPYVRRSTLISPVRPSVTSTPSASRASRCRCAPSVPGPRELIFPEDAITLCQGTGGSRFGDNHLRARPFPDELSYESDWIGYYYLEC